RDGIGFICRFELAGQKSVFGYRLRSVFRIDAGRAKEKKFLYISAMRFVHDIAGDQKILMDKFCGIGVICKNATDFRRRDINLIDAFRSEKMSDGLLIEQIEFG